MVYYMQYNTKDSSVKLAYEAQPRPKAIASFSEETIVKVACGSNHTGTLKKLIFYKLYNLFTPYSSFPVAMDSKGYVYT